MARPSKLDDDLAKRILAYVCAGNTYEIAAEATGVSRSTFYGWQSRGKSAIKVTRREDRTDDIERPYVDFFKALEKAKAIAIATAVVRVRDAMTDDWRAAIAFLERRDPSHWGKRRTNYTRVHRILKDVHVDKEDIPLVRENLRLFFPSLTE